MRELIIIGSGPAGLTAAVYTARAGLAPLVLEGLQPGGQLTITTDVENFPGFPRGIAGPQLMDLIREQAERFGSEHEYAEVDKVALDERPLKVFVEGRVEECKALIIATGASARYLRLPGEALLMGRGVSACATCDGFFYRDKEIAVVGGGDTAMEEAIFLTRFASKVTVIHRRGELRASRIMQERALEHPKIEFLWHTTVQGLIPNSEGMLDSVVLEDPRTGERREQEFAGLFYALGHTPNTGFLGNQLETDEDGYLVVHDNTRTRVPGVFVAGDVADKRYRQAITAAGMGCQAALDAERYLSGGNGI